MNSNTKKQVFVGMSGGVDSSVAAYLLKQAGHQVHGVFMKNWEGDDEDPFCSAAIDLTDARSVCDRLNIPLNVVNFSKDYWQHVFQYFLDEYAAGRTPNPDVLCNKEIKFKAFLDYSLAQGADAIATGHYARIKNTGTEFQLLKAQDLNKDQSYFLCLLNQHQLAHSLFPLGELEKTQVRKIAEEQGFINSAKKDSTGICFIGERRFKTFLSEYLLAQPGHIETEAGDIIGRHDGLMFYTLGQRQGLGIGGQKNASEAAWFVIDKDLKRNVLLVGQGNDHPRLFNQSLTCINPHWISQDLPSFPLQCAAKIRYRQNDQVCWATALNHDILDVEFELPQRAATPGQICVLYQNDVCLGGSVIRTLNKKG
jgi:tRNA-specific 2-thiouridylase